MIEWLSEPATFSNMNKILMLFTHGLVVGSFIAVGLRVAIRGVLLKVFKGRKK